MSIDLFLTSSKLLSSIVGAYSQALMVISWGLSTCLMGLIGGLLVEMPGAIASSIPLHSPAIENPDLTVDPTTYNEYPDFGRLQQVLEQVGFIVRLELPPQRGSYGLLEISSRTIWINPVVFELGIAQHTLVHEAVHAAQVCSSYDEISSLGLDLEPPHIVRPYFMRYRGIRRIIEAEAYTVQALENSTDYVIELVESVCEG